MHAGKWNYIMKVIVSEQKSYTLSEIEHHLLCVFDNLGIFHKLADKQTILLKPNMLGAHHPDKAVTTHPLIIEALIRILQAKGKTIIVGDSPGGTVKVAFVWKVCGYEDVCLRYDVPLVDFSKEKVSMYTMAETSQNIYYSQVVDSVDAIINLAKMKTHSMMLYTGAVKNLYGAIPGLHKAELHMLYPNPPAFSEVLVSLYNQIKPKIVLNVIDGIIGMDGEGPSAGKPYPFGVIISSTCAPATDYLAATMMGLDIKQLPHITLSLVSDKVNICDIDVEGKWLNYRYPKVNLSVVIFRNRVLSNLPPLIKKLIQKIFSYYPDFQSDCSLCQVCVQSCPTKALCVENKKIKLDKNTCIKCMCCHELCPDSAIFLKKSFFAKLIFRGR
jgi:uncharacterized protein (DUF362 family)/Pyruvate/2-oxoacid:ferredoxin oxidoreductase delta subunit